MNDGQPHIPHGMPIGFMVPQAAQNSASERPDRVDCAFSTIQYLDSLTSTDFAYSDGPSQNIEREGRELTKSETTLREISLGVIQSYLTGEFEMPERVPSVQQNTVLIMSEVDKGKMLERVAHLVASMQMGQTDGDEQK